jgi:hypothetical protein
MYVMYVMYVMNKNSCRVACYMVFSESEWIKTAWKREMEKEYVSVKREEEEERATDGEKVVFGEGVKLNGEKMESHGRKYGNS